MLNIFSTRRGCKYLLYVVKSLFVASRGVADKWKPPSSSGLGLRPLTAPTPVQIRSGVRRRNGSKSREACQLGYGVIGNTGDSGSSILGSSPGTPANSSRRTRAFLLSICITAICLSARPFLYTAVKFLPLVGVKAAVSLHTCSVFAVYSRLPRLPHASYVALKSKTPVRDRG